MSAKPKLAVWKFASCDGCQVSLLDCEEELLSIAGSVDIAYFLEASSRTTEGPYDVSLVEGSISTPEDEERIREVRRDSELLVTIGACATSGGIQALRNFADHEVFIRAVYAHPEYIDSLEHSLPVADLVAVDYELHGCPINKHQLLEVLASFLQGRRPNIRAESVCAECKRSATVCVSVARGLSCLGPVTHAGCGALCPSYARGCFGCYGPKELANPKSLLAWSGDGLTPMLRGFTGWAPAFRDVEKSDE